MSADAYVGINQLVPGVWAILSAQQTLRRIQMWVKLDRLSVSIGPDGEQIQVTFSPAPGSGLPTTMETDYTIPTEDAPIVNPNA
jgi:hypothetical protein